LTDVLDLVAPGDLLARSDLADQALEGLVRAGRYRATQPMHCRVPVADILSDEDQRIDQLLFGEVFDVLETQGGRAFGRARRDGVVGWAVLDSLKPGAPLATRRVAAVDAALPLNALVVEGDSVAEADLAAVGDFERDPVAVAERLLGRPHALGARSSFETDCAGLVQQCLLACGLPGPRRSHAQAEMGRAVAAEELDRGDIVVWLAPAVSDQGESRGWTGHSALMIDHARLIHSTGARGGVVIEALAEVDRRLVVDGFAAALFRRL
jgi:cell wall-associated NlpC family hydrolase